MRVLVMSDSHGNDTAVKAALAKEPAASVVIHLGDGAREAQRLAAADQSRTWHVVCGNCDVMSDVPYRKIIRLGGQTLYLTHGHNERVKSGLLTLTYTAREAEAVAALYGHTHIASTQYDGGVLLFNPGSLGYSGSYGVLEIGDGRIVSTVCHLDD